MEKWQAVQNFAIKHPFPLLSSKDNLKQQSLSFLSMHDYGVGTQHQCNDAKIAAENMMMKMLRIAEQVQCACQSLHQIPSLDLHLQQSWPLKRGLEKSLRQGPIYNQKENLPNTVVKLNQHWILPVNRWQVGSWYAHSICAGIRPSWYLGGLPSTQLTLTSTGLLAFSMKGGPFVTVSQ